MKDAPQSGGSIPPISEDRLATVRANYWKAYRAGETLIADILAKRDNKEKS